MVITGFSLTIVSIPLRNRFPFAGAETMPATPATNISPLTVRRELLRVGMKA
jgi:hypothetical protein